MSFLVEKGERVVQTDHFPAPPGWFVLYRLDGEDDKVAGFVIIRVCAVRYAVFETFSRIANKSFMAGSRRLPASASFADLQSQGWEHTGEYSSYVPVVFNMHDGQQLTDHDWGQYGPGDDGKVELVRLANDSVSSMTGVCIDRLTEVRRKRGESAPRPRNPEVRVCCDNVVWVFDGAKDRGSRHDGINDWVNEGVEEEVPS